MVNYSQFTFIKNWNNTVNYLSKNPRFKNLVKLPTDGICCGMSFALADYIRSGDEQTFYDFFNYVCESEPNTIAQLITKSTALPLQYSLIDFIEEVSVLQANQLESMGSIEEAEHSIENSQKENWKNLAKSVISAGNHDRIGSPIIIDDSTLDKEFNVVKNQELDQLSSVINKLKKNESLSISMFFNDTDEAHSILIYRSNDFFYLFDVNTGVKVQSNNVDEAAKELIYSVNLNYTNGEKKYTQLDKLWRSGLTFKILSVTALMPIVFLWLIYDVFIAKPLSDEQLKEGPLSETIELAWSIIKSAESSKPSAIAGSESESSLLSVVNDEVEKNSVEPIANKDEKIEKNYRNNRYLSEWLKEGQAAKTKDDDVIDPSFFP